MSKFNTLLPLLGFFFIFLGTLLAGYGLYKDQKSRFLKVMIILTSLGWLLTGIGLGLATYHDLGLPVCKPQAPIEWGTHFSPPKEKAR